MGISDDQKKKVAELFELGWSDGMISAEVGLSRNAVIGYRHRAGLIRANGTASVVRRGRKPIERKSPNASASRLALRTGSRRRPEKSIARKSVRLRATTKAAWSI